MGSLIKPRLPLAPLVGPQVWWGVCAWAAGVVWCLCLSQVCGGFMIMMMMVVVIGRLCLGRVCGGVA